MRHGIELVEKKEETRIFFTSMTSSKDGTAWILLHVLQVRLHE